MANRFHESNSTMTLDGVKASYVTNDKLDITNSTLSKQLNIQTQMLEALKSIDSKVKSIDGDKNKKTEVEDKVVPTMLFDLSHN